MAIPVRTSFYIEQGVWVTYSFFLVVVFSLQLQVSAAVAMLSWTVRFACLRACGESYPVEYNTVDRL